MDRYSFVSGLPVQAMILATACLTLLACFDKPADVDFDAGPRDAAVLDARRPDAGVCVPDTIVCDDASGHYIECSSAGTVTVDVACVVGCAPTEESGSGTIATASQRAATSDERKRCWCVTLCG